MRVTVAIPVLNGGELLRDVLDAVGRQRVDGELELLVADSGSSDGSRELALGHGARVVDIPPGEFSHGGTRNRLMAEARGSHVAFLTQDAVPAGDDWLALLLAAFDAADRVGLVYGPYRARADASPMVRRELEEWFGSFAPDGRRRVDRVEEGSVPDWPGPVTFFTDANGCVSREAWERVPFRAAPYAEDQLLAREMLAAGYAKVYEPRAAVVHSHEYGALDWFRRCFDEWRGLREVYGHLEPAAPRTVLARLRRELGADRRFMREQGASGPALAAGTLRSLRYHAIRAAGAAAGSRADRLPARVRGWCSLEGRRGFEPARWGGLDG